MIWGDPIEVNGVRPAWLADDVMIDWEWKSSPGTWHAGDGSYPDGCRAEAVCIENGVARILIPSDHFAYFAIAKGYEPWGGGDSAPADWDEGDVLLRIGSTCLGKHVNYWGDSGLSNDIIGYKRKQVADDGDYVSVKRMEEAELHEWTKRKFGSGATTASSLVHFCREMGITYKKKPTQAETIATKTGLTVDQAQSVLNEVNNGTR